MFAFHQIENNSEDGQKVHETMTAALRCVLEDTRGVDLEEEPTPANPFA